VDDFTAFLLHCACTVQLGLLLQ